MWLTTSQRALLPHVPGQGSRHLLRRHARSRAHSGFTTHSGRHPSYGLPVYSGRHEQAPSRQMALGPHGDGLQGSLASGGTVATEDGEREKISDS